MKIMTILEEKNLLSTFFAFFQKDFADWEINIEKISLLEGHDNSRSLKKSYLVLCEVTNQERFLKEIFNIIEKLNDDTKIILVSDFSSLSKEITDMVYTHCKENQKVYGIIETSIDRHLYIPLFRNFLKNFEAEKSDSMDMEVLIELKRELDQVALTVENELQKVKKLHEHIMPKRYSEIKGINILSKYAVGERSGGEFFDIIYKNKKIGVILSSSSSYVFSGMLLSHFSNLKKDTSLGLAELKNFIKNVSKGTEGFSTQSTDPSFMQLFVALIDLKTLFIEGFNFGKTLLISNFDQNISGNQFLLHESFFEKAYFQMQVKRGEKLILISPGIRKNTNDLIEGRPLIRYMQKLFDEKPFDMLNELFFQLKKDKDNDFLQYDASSIIIEVNKNVLVQA